MDARYFYFDGYLVAAREDRESLRCCVTSLVIRGVSYGIIGWEEEEEEEGVTTKKNDDDDDDDDGPSPMPSLERVLKY